MIPKFRAWEPDTKFMNDQVRVTSNRFGDGEILVEATDAFGWVEVQPEYLMQSTGLKDKNRVEVFQGDIVFDRWANMYTPVFQNGIYMAYNPKNLMQNDPSTQFNIIWKDGCEVIGNIYENPELLEQANES